MLVTLVGYDILKGRSLLISTPASDYAHFLVACLFHEIGYVRGVLRGDSEEGYIVDASGGKGKTATRLLRRGANALSCRSFQALCHGPDRQQ